MSLLSFLTKTDPEVTELEACIEALRILSVQKFFLPATLSEIEEIKSSDLFGEISGAAKNRFAYNERRIANVKEPVLQIIEGMVNRTIDWTKVNHNDPDREVQVTYTLIISEDEEISFETYRGHRGNTCSASWLTASERGVILEAIHGIEGENREKENKAERERITQLLKAKSSS
jgi:hypothetical protein